MSRETPQLPHPLSDADLIRLCRLFGEGVAEGVDDYTSLHLARCQLAVEIDGRTPPVSWEDAVKVEPQLLHLRCLAGMRPQGKAWAEKDYFFTQARQLVARNPRLRDPAITKLVLDTITAALEV